MFHIEVDVIRNSFTFLVSKEKSMTKQKAFCRSSSFCLFLLVIVLSALVQFTPPDCLFWYLQTFLLTYICLKFRMWKKILDLWW